MDPAITLTDSAVDDVYLINGQYQPTLSMLPGEIKIFDLINAGSGGYLLELQIMDAVGAAGSRVCMMQQVSADGVYFESPRTIEHAVMIQAQRMGIAVRCDSAGTFYLQSYPAPGSVAVEETRYQQVATRFVFPFIMSYVCVCSDTSRGSRLLFPH